MSHTQEGKSDGPDAAAAAAAAAATPVKEKKYMDLDLTSANRGVWLVKVPKYIAERWEAADPSSTVGKLTISRKPGEKPSIALNLDEKICKERTDDLELSTTMSRIPKEHKFLVGAVSSQHLGVLSRTKGPPDKMSLEGKVVQKAECKPLNDQLYMKLKREALLKPTETARKAKKLNKLVINYKPVANHANNIAYDKKLKEEGKKMRDDKEVVLEKLFGLFEKHQYYNFKDLVAETRQPVPYLKGILNEVCTYNMKNPHKNMWELKPEYRHYKVEGKGDADAKESDSE